MPYVPPLWSFTPFLVILLCIAVLPLLPRVDHWWHRNGNKLLVAGILALLTLGFYAFLHQGMLHHGHTIEGTSLVLEVLQHAVLDEYIPFIVLLFSLYTISGGILITGDIEARPMTNLAYLALGTLLASFIGTTGASMLLIRPLLRTNAERRHKVHTVVFFILLVSNIGGSLTPLGDPPLFLGFLRGVPFWWPAQHLALPWGMASLLLLSVYFLWDVLAYRKETPKAIRHDEAQVTPLGCVGGINFVWLVGVVACVALVDHNRVLPGTDWKPFLFLREGLLLLLAVLSWTTTARNAEIRKRNDFNFFAIAEVACLFIGIFICMQPALEYLNVRGSELGVQTPAQFFWASGLFSSFLDNAPTYVVFFETAKALTASGGLPADAVVQVADGSVATNLLLAISAGSVFMGANTYIGNAPNFMVKSIAESSGVRMPSFFGYFLFAVAVLTPVYLLVTFLFLS